MATIFPAAAYAQGAPAPQVQGPPAPAGAASPSDDAAMAQRLLSGVQPQRCRPIQRPDGSIVVCGGKEASEKERIPLRDETDTARSTDTGLPRAPNVSGLRDCSRGCLGLGGVPAPMYYFDIKALPPPPPGSDADRIAKGEIPAP
ncbi:Secreted protein [Novosphingobium lubricantis]